VPRFINHISSLRTGEVSPKALGNTDQDWYKHACEKLENMIPYPQGGAARRPGSRYITTAAIATADSVRLFPFVYSRTEAYCVELSVGNLRTVAASDMLTIGTLGGALTNSSSWVLADLTSAQLYGMQYVQLADVMYLVYPTLKPARFVRTASGTFTLKDFDADVTSTKLVQAYPFRTVNTGTTTLAISATAIGSGRTLTASAALFNAGHVGALFVTKVSGVYGCCKVTAVGSATSATVTVLNTFGGTGTTTEWYESAWSTYRGWPRSVEVFQRRLAYGGNSAQPDTTWASRDASYDHLSQFEVDSSGAISIPTTVNTHAHSQTAPSAQVNEIQWLSADKTMVAGTFGSENIIAGVDDTQAWGPLNPGNSTETRHGSAYVQAIRPGSTLAFVGRTGYKVREFEFNYDRNKYVSEEISILAEHMPARRSGVPSKIRQIAVREEPTTVIWCITENGALYACTRDKTLGLSAWHYHPMGGVYGTGDPAVVSIAVIPDATGAYDNLWLAVTRTMNGSTRTTIEVIQNEFSLDELDATQDASSCPRYLDCSFYMSGAASAAWTAYLNGGSPSSLFQGATFGVLADGKIHPDVTVGSSSNITLNYTATQVVFGFRYTSKVKPVRLEPGAAQGMSAQGSGKRYDKWTVRFLRTVACQVGTSDDDLKEINFRPASVGANDPIPLFTGDKSDVAYTNTDTDGYIQLQTDDPVPMAVLSITLRGVTHEV
jgi:hypothetical protein